ncbi:MAG: PKD domain-containing protein [Thermoplasmata archaeon]
MRTVDRPPSRRRASVRTGTALVAFAVVLVLFLPAIAAGLSGAAEPRSSGLRASGTGAAATGTTAPKVVLSVDRTLGYAPLQANITVTASGGSTPYNLTFCPAASSGACEQDAAWLGTPWPIREQFTLPGNYTVNATVVDANGQASVATALVQVLAVAPLTVAFSEASVRGDAPFSDAFAALIGGGVAPYTVTWSFGDGTTLTASASAPVDHTYPSAGTFTPTVTIRDARGTLVERDLAAVTVLSSPDSRSNATLGGLPVSSLTLVVATAVVATVATLGVGYALNGRRLQREANELVRQLWEEDPRGPEERP